MVWLDIATAPETDSLRPVLVTDGEGIWMAYQADWNDLRWQVVHSDTTMDLQDVALTHWMPLPPLPQLAHVNNSPIVEHVRGNV